MNPSLKRFLGIDPGADQPVNETSLEIGGDYLVVAMSTGPSCIWLFLADRFRGLRYPLIYPASLFEIRDSRCSKFWEWGKWVDRFGAMHPLLAPQPWASDLGFHPALFDGDSEVLAAYRASLETLELEYPLPWISEKARSLQMENWVSDEQFEHQWRADARFAMTIHPQTKRLMHNPNFTPSLDPLC